MTRVYKFLPEEWARDDIEKQHIKISRFCDLNDPFELSPFDLSNGDQRDALIHARKEFSDGGVGLLCFSFKWSNPLLWAHYADKHKGICLGFDLPDNAVRHVAYVSTRLPFPNPSELNKRRAQDWLFTKYSGWCYEAECRVFAKLDHEDEDGNYFANFKENEMTFREIILGYECQFPPESVLQSLLTPYDEEVKVIRARPSDESFDMIEDTAFCRRL